MSNHGNLPSLDYMFANSAMFASLRGTEIKDSLVDLSSDNETFIPLYRKIFMMNMQNVDFTGLEQNSKSPTIILHQSISFKINTVYIEFDLPAQYAKNVYDQMAYDSLPGINCIKQISPSLRNKELEIITPQIIINKYLDYYGYELFLELASKWWGGIKTKDFCDKNVLNYPKKKICLKKLN